MKLYLIFLINKNSSQQYKSEARMTSSGKTMFIPCLEDKYDGADTTSSSSIIPLDNMSLVSSTNEHDTHENSGSKCCFLSQKSIESLSELMEQLSKVVA